MKHNLKKKFSWRMNKTLKTIKINPTGQEILDFNKEYRESLAKLMEVGRPSVSGECF